MKKLILLALLIFASSVKAQSTDISDYKYVVIPQIFDFLTKKDEYNLNTITKMMFEKKGFEVYFSGEELPFEAKMDRCKVLYADLVANSKFLSTGITIVVKNCVDQEVFKSDEGLSKEKELRKAYYSALRDASQSFKALTYEYKGDKATPHVATKKEDGTSVKKSDNQLYAKPTSYGYELLDKTEKSVLKMYKTSQPDSYSAKMEDVTGVVFKKDEKWIFEYYLNDEPVTQELNIKF
ncbi:hypothetical protein GN157_08245 [Flavobacterium rakeshii]|uniref:Uncharacterized protein n=1 Tax=Flavobacterium rakeshii TaxID=1038845 RepID=A0A6N8HCR5_9FLAO|nr:hypothetical protein [Flavobacterium rakeshii]MUV03700.1 hypothetical protein [Flavobacterium rakeshii]